MKSFFWLSRQKRAILLPSAERLCRHSDPEVVDESKEGWIMAQIVVSMETVDLWKAELQSIAGKNVKILQALLNLSLTAGDVGEDGNPIPPLTLDGIAGAKTK